MLPFTKRPARRPAQESSEAINTGDFEVVRGGSSSKPSSRFPGPASDRPRVFQRSVSDGADDDRTLLMPSKLRSTIAPPKPSSAPPPPMPSVRPLPAPSLKGLVRPRLDEERTMLRPSVPVPAPSSPPRAASPAMMPTPYMPFKPPVPSAGAGAAAKKSSAPPPINAKGGSDRKAKPGDSDARLEVPAAIITQRTRILPLRKPSLSWAAALVALGVFTGLVTAVVARGDADSLLDATASLVDPTAARPAAAPGAQLPAAIVNSLPSNGAASNLLPAGAATACGTDTPSPPQPIAQSPVNPPPKAEPVAAASPNPPQTAKPEPPKPPPVAWAAPRPAAPRPMVAPAAAPAPAPAPQPQAVAAAPKPAPKPAAAAPAPKGGGSEMESAAAADALAKAQLEASLR